MPLTDKAIQNAKSAEKPRRLFDGGGLYLEVSPRGGKWWGLKYRFDGEEKRLSLGVYPDVSLKKAGKRRDEARDLMERNKPQSAGPRSAALRSVAGSWSSTSGCAADSRVRRFDLRGSDTGYGRQFDRDHQTHAIQRSSYTATGRDAQLLDDREPKPARVLRGRAGSAA